MHITPHRAAIGVATIHAALVAVFCVVGWLATNDVFTAYITFALDFPVSLAFEVLRHAMSANASGSYDLANRTEDALHLIVGSLWYYCLTLLIIYLWRKDRIVHAAFRKLWDTNVR
jgi:putative copper export protein